MRTNSNLHSNGPCTYIKAVNEISIRGCMALLLYLGYDIEEIAGLLAMSVRSVKRYLSKYLRMSEVNGYKKM